MSPLEGISDRGFWKSLWFGDIPGTVDAEFINGALIVQYPVVNSKEVDEEFVRRTLTKMLGLDQPTEEFARIAAYDPVMHSIVQRRAGLRVPCSPNVYEALVWAIIGQQINLRFAADLRRALVRRCGILVDQDERAHPRPGDVAILDYSDLTSLRFSRSKAAYLIDVSRLIAEGKLNLENLALKGPIEMERQLLEVRGIGVWTARYILLRGAGFPDVVPTGDAGLRNAIHRAYGMKEKPTNEQTEELMGSFAPYRSLASYHLWMSL